MDGLVATAERIGQLLIARKETIAVGESSTGGLISAALLSVPGASAYFMGGAVVYTRQARRALLQIPNEAVAHVRSASEPYAAIVARTIREQHRTTWGLSETGATGPTGNRYGDAAGHCCIGLSGPLERTLTLETGAADRRANMHAFAARALGALLEALETNGMPR
ncbi:MAG: CinA family protein [Hyphomicrobiaceae bacterium]|nr:CinA family protein [Hyphomicrobiaceae bacterium]